MTGIIVKDLIYLRRQVKTMAILLIFYIIMFSMMQETSQIISMFSMIMVLLSSILMMNTFAYDELSKWDIYSLSLPVTKVQLVLCKYFLTFVLSGVGVLLSIAVALAKQALNLEAWVGIYTAFGVAVLFCSILIPLLFKFGVQRARILLVCIIMIPTAGIFFLINLKVPALGEASLIFLLKISPVALVVFIALSIFISCRVFQNKEL